jgi:thiosulfate/3-mercaptopyruvate sulfurtransferase
VDVRASARFLGIQEPIDPVAGHIPGAINIPLTENLDAEGFFKSPQQLQQLYAEANARCEPKQQVYMCGSGVTACHSVFAQCLAGSDMPRVYAGSWSEWIRDLDRPMVTRKDEQTGE